MLEVKIGFLFGQLLFSDLLLLQAGRVLQHLDIYIILSQMHKSDHGSSNKSVLDSHLRGDKTENPKRGSVSSQCV